MEKRLETIITGKVQMVTFRAFAAENAAFLDIKGTVSNETDGSVKIVAEGNEMSLRSLLLHLHEGPPDAEVEKVEEMWGEPTGEFTDFIIVY